MKNLLEHASPHTQDTVDTRWSRCFDRVDEKLPGIDTFQMHRHIQK